MRKLNTFVENISTICRHFLADKNIISFEKACETFANLVRQGGVL